MLRHEAKQTTMNTVYIVMSLAIIIVGIKNYLEGYVNSIDWIVTLILGIIGGFALGIIVALSISSEKKWVLNNTYELQSFQDNSSLQGGFFLGTGIINETMKYSFYYKIDGGFKLMQLDYKDVIVTYSKKSPKVEQYRETDTDATINKYSLSFNDTKYIVYVPEGTIKQNYVLDSE